MLISFGYSWISLDVSEEVEPDFLRTTLTTRGMEEVSSNVGGLDFFGVVSFVIKRVWLVSQISLVWIHISTCVADAQMSYGISPCSVVFDKPNLVPVISPISRILLSSMSSKVFTVRSGRVVI